MAEFKDVIRNWNNVCHTYFDDEHGCMHCPLKKGCDPMAMTDEELEEAEKIVMKYQAPIYPKLIDLIHYIAVRMPPRNDGKEWARDIPLYELVQEHIPDEVAEELGLVPINECGLTKYLDKDELEVSEWR